MSNYGLKSYCKGITNSICNVGNVTVSLCQNDANLIIEIPLISTKGLAEFSTSLVFNLQCINTLSEFGNGFRLNYKNSLQLMYENNELVNVQVKNCDGSVDNHYLVDNYYNKETETTINIIEENNAIYYELVDKYGNKSKYSESFLEYPYEIEMSTSEILYVDMRNNQDKIINRNGDEIRFIRNGSIEYYHNYELIERIQLNISNRKLIGLTRYKLEESYSCSIAYGYEDDELINIIVKDNITNYRVKYILDGNKVISYITGYDDLFTNGKITQITYVDNYKTIVTDEYLDSTAYYFDNNGLFLYSIGSNGYGYKEIYNNDSKKIEYQSEEISFKGRLNNLLPSNDINCFTRSEVTISSIYNDDISLQDALGNSVRRVIGTGTLKYTLLVD